MAKSHLSGRNQFCLLNGQSSRIEKVISGIPQGLCLGPLLFIIYLTDFESCLEFSNANMYAENTYTTIASIYITELICTKKKELFNISECLRVARTFTDIKPQNRTKREHPKNRTYGYQSPT